MFGGILTYQEDRVCFKRNSFSVVLCKIIWCMMMIHFDSIIDYDFYGKWSMKCCQIVLNPFFLNILLYRKSWVSSTGTAWSPTLHTETYSPYGHWVNTAVGCWDLHEPIFPFICKTLTFTLCILQFQSPFRELKITMCFYIQVVSQSYLFHQSNPF